MRKRDLIHLHGVFDEIVSYCGEKGEAFDLEEYEDLETRPHSIHHSKTEHKAAVFALCEATSDTLNPEAEQADRVKVNKSG